MKKTKRPFTLMEVMICLALMAMLGGFLAIKSGKLISEHRNRNELAKLKSELRLTRHLSRSLQADITLKLTQSDEGLVLTRTSDEPDLPKKEVKIFPHLTIEEEITNFYAGNGYIYFDNKFEKFNTLVK